MIKTYGLWLVFNNLSNEYSDRLAVRLNDILAVEISGREITVRTKISNENYCLEYKSCETAKKVFEVLMKTLGAYTEGGNL